MTVKGSIAASGKDGQEHYVGSAAAYAAKWAYDKKVGNTKGVWNGEIYTRSDLSSGENTDFDPETYGDDSDYMYRQGWGALISAKNNKGEELIGSLESGLKPNVDDIRGGDQTQQAYEQNVASAQNVNTDDIAASGTGVSGTASVEDAGIQKEVEGNNTKIGPYYIDNVGGSDVTKSVTVRIQQGNTYNAELKKESDAYYVVVKNIDLMGEIIEDITLEQSYKTYYAYLVVLSTNYHQARLLSDAGEDTVENTVHLKIPPKVVDVSLQKYITKVNGKNITSSDTSLISRRNTFARQGDTNRLVNTHPSPSNTATSRYKQNEYVNIEAGDTVTYRIEVYNNDKIDATRFIVGESFSDEATWVGAKNASGATVTWSRKDDHKYYYSIPGGLKAGKSTYFDITLRWSKYSTEVLWNASWIEAKREEEKNHFGVWMIPDAKGYWDLTYRQCDFDYIKMRPYKVSLEKFITKVEGGAGKNETPSPSRAGKRCHDALPDNSTGDRNLWKRDNQYEVEPGDKVTYTIRLKNTGDYPVKITQIYESFRYVANGVQLVYDSSYGIRGNGGGTIINNHYNGPNNDWGFNALDRKLIKFNNATLLSPGATTDVTIRFTVQIPTNLTATTQEMIFNKAVIVEIQNRNNVVVADSDGGNNNADNDYVKYTRLYAVKLEKYISRVNNTTRDTEGTTLNRSEEPEHCDDNNANTTNNWKSNNVAVVGKGDEVTYTITVTNEHANTSVYITNIKDTLPTGISQYKVGSGSWRSRPSNGVINITDTRNTLLAPGKSTSVTVTVKVTESNLSLNVFKNEAEITEMKNRNQVTVIDTTLNNNKDADYFELKDITIHGKVWNDVARNKTNDSYNGKYESGKKEKLLEDITVRLFRNNTEVATTKTNNKGEYTFSRSNLNSNLADNTRYIKGPRNTPTNNRWSGTYYSYYVVFEYDGITYTCSLNNQQNPTYVPVNTSLPTDYKIDSNAAENNGKVNMTRENFNKQFTTIKNDGAYNANNQKSMNLEYDTKNENGYVPQSIHKTKANIQASTNLINLSNNNNLEEQLLNVDLGLRGRDIFDLHLDSSVAHTDLSVHGQTTRYEYEDNEKASVTFKPEDLGIVEDMANVAREKVDGEADVNSNGTKKENATDYGVSQNIRRGDYNANYANANDITGQTRHNTQNVDLNIKVTYRINVVNESQTDGYANIIRDYYDDRYKLANANLVYQERELKNGKETVKYETTIAKSSVTDNVDSGNGFSAVSIPLPNGRVLSQDRMAVVYITFEMKDPNATLKPMVDGKTTKVPTYNMAEIWQYTTKGTRSQTEFTRGLLDKDSAPGSANREQVRKVSTQGRNTDLTGVNPTTVQYYFERPSQSGSNQYWKAKNDLTDLKYEDDTYAAPTLYFVDRTVQRVLSGTVYHDGLLPMDTNTYIKTGNGKLDSGEKGVAGVLVELLEVENNGNLKPIISTHTKADGSFTLTKFMPAKYALRYTYGSTRQCIVAYAVNANTNEDSFNGEDYQSTNNTGNRAGVARLADTDKDYWYITNASNKISTGTDDVNRRRTVARTVTGYTDAQMRTLQKARNTRDDRSITLSNSEVQQIADSTKMYSNTPNFLVAVEKPTGLTSKSTRFTDTYIIEEMDLGLMETPKTEITLEKKITSFTIKDASGTNTLASWNINSGKSAGDVLKLNEGDGYDVSIVDDQLQGAKLEVTFKINANVKVERNYDATGNPVQPITAVADFIDNDLSFNADLLVGDGTEHTNADYWTIVPYQTSGGVEGIQDTLRRRANEAKAYIGTVSPSDTRYNGTNGYGTLDQPGKAYSVIVKATNSNPILSPTKTSTGYTSTSSITLEKVLSSEETTIRDIVTSNINTYEYNNHVEVLNLDYTNTKTGATGNDFIFMDRIIRNPRDNDPDYDDELYGRDDKTEYVMIAGVQHDSAESERITVHPPTGEMKGNQYYYVAIGAIMIIILGVAGIKKIALKEE